MGDHQRRHRGGGGGFGEDRISGLPDALLHEILVRLRSASAAARTSVLSRRWRHLWAHLPELRLVALPSREAAPASFIDTVDAALGGYLAPTLEHLGVSHHVTDIQGRDLRISPARIAPWLHFAAAHVVGELNLYLRVPQTFGASTPEIVWDEEAAVLELPQGIPLGSSPFPGARSPRGNWPWARLRWRLEAYARRGGRPDPRVFPGVLPHVSRHRARFRSWVALSSDARRRGPRRRCAVAARHPFDTRRHCAAAAGPRSPPRHPFDNLSRPVTPRGRDSTGHHRLASPPPRFPADSLRCGRRHLG